MILALLLTKPLITAISVALSQPSLKSMQRLPLILVSDEWHYLCFGFLACQIKKLTLYHFSTRCQDAWREGAVSVVDFCYNHIIFSALSGHPKEEAEQRPDWTAGLDWQSLWGSEEGRGRATCPEGKNCKSLWHHHQGNLLQDVVVHIATSETQSQMWNFIDWISSSVQKVKRGGLSKGVLPSMTSTYFGLVQTDMWWVKFQNIWRGCAYYWQCSSVYSRRDEIKHGLYPKTKWTWWIVFGVFSLEMCLFYTTYSSVQFIPTGTYCSAMFRVRLLQNKTEVYG